MKKNAKVTIRLEEWPVDRICPYPGNPRKNDAAVARVAALICEYGFRNPVEVDADGIILRGHTRWKAAQQLGLATVPVLVTDGLSPEQARAWRIADNASQEWAEWNLDLLRVELAPLVEAEFDLTLTGLDEKFLAGLTTPSGANSGGSGDPGPQVNRADELRQKWGVERGQLWKLGPHRLLCGDATDEAAVQRLALADVGCLVFDPPWDAECADRAVRVDADATLAFSDGGRLADVLRRFGTAPAWVFAWDCCTSWYTPNRPLRRMKFCLWYGDVTCYQFDGAHYGDPDPSGPRQVSNPRGSYMYHPDPRGKHLADVFQRPITQAHATGLHVHEKPVDWIRCLVGNCSSGQIVDLFAGSGSSLVAAQELGRVCMAMEIDPGTVAGILERFKVMGLMPELM